MVLTGLKSSVGLKDKVGLLTIRLFRVLYTQCVIEIAASLLSVSGSYISVFSYNWVMMTLRNKSLVKTMHDMCQSN